MKILSWSVLKKETKEQDEVKEKRNNDQKRKSSKKTNALKSEIKAKIEENEITSESWRISVTRTW